MTTTAYWPRTKEGGTAHTWAEVDCPCRDDGPWIVYGPRLERYHCTRCGHLMTRRAL